VPWLGRWTSADPTGIKDGINVFAYTRNQPCCGIDRNGKQSFNTGDPLQSFEDESGNTFVEFRARENTWISAAAKSLGLDEKYSKEQGYGAYVKGVVLNDRGQPFENVDKLEVGEIFYIRIRSAGDKPVPSPKPQPARELESSPKPEGWAKFTLRNAIDLFTWDKVTIEIQGDAGGGAQYFIGGGLYGGGGVAATLILNPNSPDFLKASVNPFGSVDLSGKLGLEVGGGPQVSGGVSVGFGEHIGDARNATLASLPGPQVGLYGGGEGQAIIGVEGTGSVLVSGTAIDDFWVDTELGVSVLGEGAGGVSLVGGGIYKEDFESIGTFDLMTETGRDLHRKYYEWIHSGRE
jgi:hypothetical protein